MKKTKPSFDIYRVYTIVWAIIMAYYTSMILILILQLFGVAFTDYSWGIINKGKGIP